MHRGRELTNGGSYWGPWLRLGTDSTQMKSVFASSLSPWGRQPPYPSKVAPGSADLVITRLAQTV